MTAESDGKKKSVSSRMGTCGKGIVLVACCVASAAALAATVTLNGETTYNVASGTNTVSDTLTGGGSILKTGNGALNLTGVGNDFTGGTKVNAGAVLVNALNALGSGSVEVAAKTAGVWFNVAPATTGGYTLFGNALAFTGTEDCSFGGAALGGWNKPRWEAENNRKAVSVKSDQPATLTITGMADDKEACTMVRGAVSLVLDAQDHPSFVQTFTHFKSAFTGTTTVRKGTLRITGKARFTGTPSITLARDAATPAHGLTVFRGPVGAYTNDAAGTAHIYTIDAPLTLEGPVTFHADTNSTPPIRSASTTAARCASAGSRSPASARRASTPAPARRSSRCPETRSPTCCWVTEMELRRLRCW